MWMVKLRRNISIQLVLQLQNKMHVFCCPFFRTFSDDRDFWLTNKRYFLLPMYTEMDIPIADTTESNALLPTENKSN